jgi:hypothetical protein
VGTITTKWLRVTEAVKEDVYKDIARIHWDERGRDNHVGAIVSIKVDGGRKKYFSLRGLGNDRFGEIALDHVARTELKLELNDRHEFTIEETSAWEKLKWAVKANDPTARIAVWIAVWSGIVGIAGLVLALIGLYPAIKEIHHDVTGGHAPASHCPSASVASPPPLTAPLDSPAAGRSEADKP